VNEPQFPFALLTHEEFAKLSTEQKVMYLARAMEALADERGPVFAGLSSQNKPTLQ
jgi:hypothetical protein